MLLPAKFINLVSSVSVFNAISNERRNNYPTIYTELNKIARIQSIKGSNAIEGNVTSDERIRSIISGECAPLNHDEKEIIGYRNALDIIHASYTDYSHGQACGVLTVKCSS